eukprot:COSAG02_NODE_2159_length_9628_cov_7.080596_6_plen_302_part_00
MALSGKRAQARRKQQKQQQQQQQQHSPRWLQDAVMRALVALKARSGASLHAVQRHVQNSFSREYRPLSAKRVQGALAKVAHCWKGLWKLSDTPDFGHHQSAAASPAVSPVSEATTDSPSEAQAQQKMQLEEDCHLEETECDERDQYARLKEFIRKCEQRGAGHELRRAHFISARTLHGPISLQLSFLTTRRSMGLERTVFEDEMRGNITVSLGASATTPIVGAVAVVQTGATQAAVTGQLHTNGSATLRLGNLDLRAADFATPAYSCLRRGGGYVDFMGFDVTSSESSLVRAYLMLTYTAA